MALADAGLLGRVDARSVIGTAIGNAMGDDVFEVERLGGPPVEGLDAFFFEVAAATGAALGLCGPSLNVSTACSAGLYSISLATELIQSGQADVFVAGGSEAICRAALGCFNRLSAIDPEACRPFDASRKGTVMGEGAAILVLESEEHLRRRGGSRVYGQIEGAGWSCDGHHATIPEPSGKHALAAARRALAEASLEPSAIGCVLAHGTGTAQNDQMESVMIQELFGDRAHEVWVCGVKGKLGHGGGAAGAFQCLTGALVLDRGIAPPTGNVSSVDPSCKVRLDRGHGQPARVDHVLMNSYAFGGNNISLILGRASVDS
jgi:3-oxoacyl-(acyl-carrier-protein) synthase